MTSLGALAAALAVASNFATVEMPKVGLDDLIQPTTGMVQEASPLPYPGYCNVNHDDAELCK